MKIAFLTQARPETTARIPTDLPHVVAHAQPDGTYTAEDLARLADVDALMVSAEPVHDQLLEACPKVKIVQRMGVGYNTLDLEACRRRNIPACNVAGVNKEAVAEHNMTLILALAKALPEADQTTRALNWPAARMLTKRTFELYNKTLGIVGLGDTGSSLARRAKGFEMRIVYNEIREIDPAVVREVDATFMEKDELFRTADIVAICVDLNPTALNMVDARRLALMKRSALLVCSARGGIVDEAALRKALDEEQIAGAGIDVFSVEPVPAGNPLLEAKHCILTSHVAGVNPETQERSFSRALDNVLGVLQRGEKPRWVVNGVE